MEIRYEIRPSGVAVISPAGVLDLMVAPALRRELHALVNDGAKQLLVDLTDVVMIDSTCLGVLVSGLKAVRRKGGDLRITGGNERVMTLLQLAKLADVLKVADSDGEVTG